MKTMCKNLITAFLLIGCWIALGQQSQQNGATNTVPAAAAPAKQLTPEEIQVKIKELRADAEKGNPKAQNYLGDLYFSGRHVPKDLGEGIKWYQKSAEKGDAFGQFNLAVSFENGEGVTTNIATALKWYAKSARQGFPLAQYNLGLLYIKGGKVRKNSSKGAELIQKAAWQNDRLAQVAIASLYLNGTGLKTNAVEACAWLGVVAKNEGFKNDQRVQYNYNEIQRSLNPEQQAEANRKTEALIADIAKRIQKPIKQ